MFVCVTENVGEKANILSLLYTIHMTEWIFHPPDEETGKVFSVSSL
jgi:hypothetical protein